MTQSSPSIFRVEIASTLTKNRACAFLGADSRTPGRLPPKVAVSVLRRALERMVVARSAVDGQAEKHSCDVLSLNPFCPSGLPQQPPPLHPVKISAGIAKKGFLAEFLKSEGLLGPFYWKKSWKISCARVLHSFNTQQVPQNFRRNSSLKNDIFLSEYAIFFLENAFGKIKKISCARVLHSFNTQQVAQNFERNSPLIKGILLMRHRCHQKARDNVVTGRPHDAIPTLRAAGAPF